MNRQQRRSKQGKADLRQIDILNQMHMDAFLIAVNELFHVGKGRAEECGSVYMEAFQSIVDAMNNGMDYAQERVDNRLRDIVPEERFQEWTKRYHIKEKR